MRMTIVGKNPRAGGSECIIFGHFNAANHRFTPLSLTSGPARSKREELSWEGGWDVRPMRPGDGHGLAPALVGHKVEGDSCRTTGRLVMVSHSWSGVLQINNIGRKYTIDLYSEETRLVLLDIVNEIIVDVTRLAAAENGELRLADMTVEDVVRHVADGHAWFRLLDRDSDFDPGALRRAVEWWRGKPDDRLKARLLAALLPRLAARPAPTIAHAPHPPAPPLEDAARLRDELRLLAAAVEGLALRSAARA
jgi:hypothetical protein